MLDAVAVINNFAFQCCYLSVRAVADLNWLDIGVTNVGHGTVSESCLYPYAGRRRVTCP